MFDADLLICLDWGDPQLGAASFLAEELPFLDWGKVYFNPSVSFDNSRGREMDDGFLQGADRIPRLASEVDPVTGLPRPDERGRIWMKKTMRWRGELMIIGASLRSFPFDVHLLPFVLKAHHCRLAPDSHVTLVDPARRLSDPQYR